MSIIRYWFLDKVDPLKMAKNKINSLLYNYHPDGKILPTEFFKDPAYYYSSYTCEKLMKNLQLPMKIKFPVYNASDRKGYQFEDLSPTAFEKRLSVWRGDS